MTNCDQVEDSYVYNTAYLRHYDYPSDQLLNENFKYKTRFCINQDEPVFKHLITQFTQEPMLDRKFVSYDVSNGEKELSKLIENYHDVVYCRRSIESISFPKIYATHIVNHILRCRSLNDKNNLKASKNNLPDDSLRDQGFHRARVLVIVPTREFARQFVHSLLALMPKGAVVSNKKRFDMDYSPIEGLENQSKKNSNKPDDFKQMFSNNTDDHFRIGMTIAKKSVKLYSSFADSDVIVASPLGLKTIIDSEGEDKELDIQNITASIEMLVIDRAEFLLMQNWRNVQLVVSHLNLRPTQSKFPNPARIRLAHLAGLGKHYRQSLVFSSIDSPFLELLAASFSRLAYFPYVPTFPKSCTTFLPHLVQSRLKFPQGTSDKPIINLKTIPFFVKDTKSNKDLELIKDDSCSSKDPFGNHIVSTYDNMQSSHDCNHIKGSAIPSARIAAFKQRILPRLIRGNDKRVLIYVPDFYDAEILKMFLQKEGLEFCYINEYSSDSEGDRFRSLFGEGKIRILMITERYYFYKRRRIVGAINFIFLSPPTFPWFGTELISTGFFKNVQKTQEQETDAKEPNTKRMRVEFEEKSQQPQYNVTILYFSLLESTLLNSFLGSAAASQTL